MANWNLRVKTAALETILEVVEFWFMPVLADLCFCMRNKQLIYTRGSYEILDSFLILMFMYILMFMCSQPFYPFKDLSILANLANTEKLSWNIYCSLWLQEWRIEFYSTKNSGYSRLLLMYFLNNQLGNGWYDYWYDCKERKQPHVFWRDKIRINDGNRW